LLNNQISAINQDILQLNKKLKEYENALAGGKMKKNEASNTYGGSYAESQSVTDSNSILPRESKLTRSHYEAGGRLTKKNPQNRKNEDIEQSEGSAGKCSQKCNVF
jgi:hypothetical protein